MANNKKIVRYRRPFQLNIGFIVFVVIFFYMAFYVYSYFTSSHVSVYEVVQGRIARNNTYTGLALRSEEIVASEYAGAINYYMKDGAKAGVGSLVYSVDSDGTIARQIQDASLNDSALDEESLKELEEMISDYSTGYHSRDFYQVYTFKNDLNAKLSEALSISALNSITNAVTAAEGNATFHKGTAKKDGIVVYSTDGFEEITTENYKPKMFDESVYSKTNLKERTSVNAGDAAYKLITQEDWNLVVPITEDTKKKLANSSTIRIRFRKDHVIARASFKIDEKEESSFLILSLSNSMIRYASDRFIEIELIFDEETGLKIPNSAITSKDFFMIPMEYFHKGGISNENGLQVRKTSKDGTATDSFVTPDIYYMTEFYYYVDGEKLNEGDVLIKPNSSETYTVYETGKLEGIYCINKGYAVFRRIELIHQNAEYSIIQSGTDYGVSLYDYIALDGSAVTENAIINE